MSEPTTRPTTTRATTTTKAPVTTRAPYELTIDAKGVITGFTGLKASDLKTVVIPYTVSGIAKNVFSGCVNLKTVTRPFILPIDSVSLDYIGPTAFSGCTSLEDITILTSEATYLAPGCFENCSKLAKVNLSSVKSIGTGAFKGCTKLKDISLDPYSIEEIGFSCFENTPYAPTWAADIPLYLAKGATVGK